ncbi:MAG: Arc/MetJ-type ribon-helix-helix transcriptional regulator [Natronomonas sp.]|jgi:Arc/MetJ-type ribon-helix-helix transcriptional regulator
MPRLTVTISDEHERILERQADSGEAYRSKSEVIRECIEAHERVEQLSEQLACLEAEVELLRDQRATLKEKAARVDELESQLRQLQTAYHRAISEGKSPQELEPITEQPIEPGPSAEALIEEAESTPADSPTTTVESSPDTQAIEAAEPVDSAVGESAEPMTKTAGSADPETPVEPTAESPSRDGSRSDATGEVTASVTPPTGAESGGQTDRAESATDGGVEIDEELLYQSPGVGSRLKSALFGGPGGSR